MLFFILITDKYAICYQCDIGPPRTSVPTICKERRRMHSNAPFHTLLIRRSAPLRSVIATFSRKRRLNRAVNRCASIDGYAATTDVAGGASPSPTGEIKVVCSVNIQTHGSANFPLSIFNSQLSRSLHNTNNK